MGWVDVQLLCVPGQPNSLPGVLCYEKHKVCIAVYLSEYTGYTDGNTSFKLVRSASRDSEKIDPPHIKLEIQKHLCTNANWEHG